MSDPNDLSEILLQAPPESWVALNEEKTQIVGSGKTMKDALDQARQNGFDDPILFWCPASWNVHVF